MRKLFIFILALVIAGVLCKWAMAWNIGVAQTGKTNIGVCQRDPAAGGGATLKSIWGVPLSDIKKINGIDIGDIKSVGGLTTQ